MTSAQVVETSVTVTDNSPFQDYPHPNDHTTRSTVTPGFKPFTVLIAFFALQYGYLQDPPGVDLEDVETSEKDAKVLEVERDLSIHFK